MPDTEYIRKVQCGVITVMERIHKQKAHVDITMKFADGKLVFFHETKKTNEKDILDMFDSERKRG